MTDIQAALGESQMARIDRFIARRRELAQRYDELLKNLPLTLPRQCPDTESAWHLYVIRVRLDEIKKTHRQVFEELRAAGVGVNLHYIPVHTQPYYQKIGFKPGQFPRPNAITPKPSACRCSPNCQTPNRTAWPRR
jgi:dTDP-4-amino-4,6-dideoxygalactose transaminase